MREAWKWLAVVLMVILMYRFVNRDSLMYRINQNLPPQEAGILGGMLLGDRSGFNSDFYTSLKNSGLVHLVVVSGSNVMLVVTVVIESLAWVLGRKKTIILALALAWGYAQLAGWQVPVVRAVLLVSFLYWAQLLGKKFNVIRGLGLAAVMMVMGEPKMLTDISFWLSMAAFWAVASGKRFSQAGLGIWVTLWISPVLAIAVGKVSILAPIANMLVIGLTETVTLLGMGLLAIGGWGLMLLWPLLHWLIWVVEGLGGGWAAPKISVNWAEVTGWYLILIGIKRKWLNED